MKFVKAKELVATTSDVEKVKFEKRPKMTAQRVITKPPNPTVSKLKAKGKSLPKSLLVQVPLCHTRPNCFKL